MCIVFFFFYSLTVNARFDCIALGCSCTLSTWNYHLLTLKHVHNHDTLSLHLWQVISSDNIFFFSPSSIRSTDLLFLSVQSVSFIFNFTHGFLDSLALIPRISRCSIVISYALHSRWSKVRSGFFHALCSIRLWWWDFVVWWVQLNSISTINGKKKKYRTVSHDFDGKAKHKETEWDRETKRKSWNDFASSETENLLCVGS